VPVYEELCRDDVQLLTDILADALHGSAALKVRASRVLGFVAMLDTFQVFGQRLAAWPTR